MVYRVSNYFPKGGETIYTASNKCIDQPEREVYCICKKKVYFSRVLFSCLYDFMALRHLIPYALLYCDMAYDNGMNGGFSFVQHKLINES